MSKQARFPLGQVVATPGALEALDNSKQSAVEFVCRHAKGDWGLVCEEDKATNDQAVANEGRLLSAYETSKGERLWIITEWDRSVTTILLPSEY